MTIDCNYASFLLVKLFSTLSNNIFQTKHHHFNYGFYSLLTIRTDDLECFFQSFSQLFRQYINDIFFISFGFSNTKSIQTALTNIFQNNSLTLTFREVNNRQTGQEIKFLDIFHQIEEDNPIGFETKNFTKPTAAGRTFLHGNSYHPLRIFKRIVFSEAVRLRRLNERQEDYMNSIKE